MPNATALGPLAQLADFVSESGDVARCMKGEFSPEIAERVILEIDEARTSLNQLEGSIRAAAAARRWEIRA